MKKFSFSAALGAITLLSILSLSACLKDLNKTKLNEMAIIQELFANSMKGGPSGKTDSIAYQINISVDTTIAGPEGGTMHLLGNMTGNINDNGSGLLLPEIVMAINDYSWMVDDVKYTMQGAPYVSSAGMISLLPGGTVIGNDSSFDIGGGIRITAKGLDKTINFQVHINITYYGNYCSVSGTFDGHPISGGYWY